MQRIFIRSDQLINQEITLDEATAHHLFNVCRLDTNDLLEIVLNHERLLHVRINDIKNNRLNISIIDQWAISPQRRFNISLIQSLPKQDKLTDVCRLCTELGVGAFYPVISEYCDVTCLSENKHRRAQNAIISAAKQSKQTNIPILHATTSLETCLESLVFSPTTLRLVAYEHSTQFLPNVLNASTFDHLVLAIGPEGGFGSNDLSLFSDHNFHQFSLGKFILRTEHAGFAAINQLDGGVAMRHPNYSD